MLLKTPLAVILTDTHIKDGNESLIVNIFEQAFTLCQSLKIKKIIHCGDFFTYRSHQSLSCLLTMKRILKRAAQLGIIIDGMNGNHDKTNLNSDEGYMSLYDNYKSLRLYEAPEWTIELSKKCDEIVFAYLPYYTEGLEYLSRLNDLINDIENNGYGNNKKILFTHTSIEGVRNNDGTHVDGDSGNGAAYFEYFELVISGHYHDRQELSEKIIYIGSSHQGNFGEDFDKGFAVLYDDISIGYVQADFPLYIKTYVDVEREDITKVNQDIEKHLNKESEFADKVNVRVILKGKREKLDSVDKSQYEGLDVKEESEETEVLFDNIKDAHTESLKFDTKSLAKNWIEYCKKMNISNDKRIEGIKLLTTMRVQHVEPQMD